MSYFKRVWEEQKSFMYIFVTENPKHMYNDFIYSYLLAMKNFKFIFKLIPFVGLLFGIVMAAIGVILAPLVLIGICLIVIPLLNISLYPKGFFKKYIYNSDSK